MGLTNKIGLASVLGEEPEVDPALEPGPSQSVAIKSTHHKVVQTGKRVSSFHHPKLWITANIMRGNQFIHQGLVFGDITN